MSDGKRPRREGIDLTDDQVDFLRRICEEGGQKREWRSWFKKHKKSLSRILGDNDLMMLEDRSPDILKMVLKWHGVTPRDVPVSEVEALPEVRAMLAQHLTCTLLCPVKADNPALQSRMGGQPEGLALWPLCPNCGVAMNFVLQIFRDEFPQMHFPENRSVFFIFRCPDPRCCDNDNRYDRTTVWIYADGSAGSSQLDRPDSSAREEWEKQLDGHSFQPAERIDHPSFVDECEAWWGKPFARFSDRFYGSQVFGKFFEVIKQNQQGTKIGGFPSWQQEPDVPVCRCRRKKVFFFQLASFCRQAGADDKSHSGYVLCIGDVGNIYFFYCPACGSETIETKWDILECHSVNEEVS